MVDFSATAAFTMCLQGMMGPYAKYGLIGAGAGLLFYAFGAQKGGPVSMPGSSCKLNMSPPCILEQVSSSKKSFDVNRVMLP